MVKTSKSFDLVKMEILDENARLIFKNNSHMKRVRKTIKELIDVERCVYHMEYGFNPYHGHVDNEYRIYSCVENGVAKLSTKYGIYIFLNVSLDHDTFSENFIDFTLANSKLSAYFYERLWFEAQQLKILVDKSNDELEKSFKRYKNKKALFIGNPVAETLYNSHQRWRKREIYAR